MKVYVVIEDYTCAFCGVFKTEEAAQIKADEVGGMVIECEVE